MDFFVDNFSLSGDLFLCGSYINFNRNVVSFFRYGTIWLKLTMGRDCLALPTDILLELIEIVGTIPEKIWSVCVYIYIYIKQRKLLLKITISRLCHPRKYLLCLPWRRRQQSLSERRSKLPVNTTSFSKDCCFIGNSVKTQITQFPCCHDAVGSAKYFNLKIPAGKGIFISALSWWHYMVFISLRIEQLSGRESWQDSTHPLESPQTGSLNLSFALGLHPLSWITFTDSVILRYS
jgi:hypothetical protein